MSPRPRIPALPFRSFLNYDELDRYLHALVSCRPELCTLDSLGKSRAGREVLLLTVTDLSSGNSEDKPAYLVHGNIHAGELAGTHAALYTARQLLSDNARSDILKRVAFHIVPRLNPDGAEHVVTTSGRIRSRTDWDQMKPNTLFQEDVNGDGLILTMRKEHPDGNHALDPKDKRLLIQRTPETRGPYFRSMPEGSIHAWDGSDRIWSEGRGFDWNRNWSYDWRPEPLQYGAGDFPFSEPEMRHIAEFIHGRPNLFGILGYHTGPAAVLRPPSTGSLSDINESDERVMEDIARLAAKETGFPVMPVIKYRGVRNRDNNLRGHFHNFGYHHLGLFVYEFELGTIKDSAGITTEEQFGAETEADREEQMRRLMKWWDRQRSKAPLFRPWKTFLHPQLGPVDIGGFCFNHLANPALPDLAKISQGTYRFTLAHANKHPNVSLEDLQVDAVGGQVYRIRVRVVNRGEFPTNVTQKGRLLRRLQPVQVEFHPANGVESLSSEGHRDLGHLAGVTGGRELEWFVSAGKGSEELCSLRIQGGTGGNLNRTVRIDEGG